MSGEASNTLRSRLHEPTESGRPEGVTDSTWHHAQEGLEEAGAITPTNTRSHPGSRALQSLNDAAASLEIIREINGGAQSADAYLLSRGINVEEMMQTSDRLIQSISSRTRALDENNGRPDSHLENITRTAGSQIFPYPTSPLTGEEGISRLAEAMRNAELARNALTSQHRHSQHRQSDIVNGIIRSYGSYSVPLREGHEHHQDTREQHRQVVAPQINSPSGSGISSTNNPSTSTSLILSAGTATYPGTSNVIEQSSTARRDLERALRDYRIARRTGRPWSHTDTSSPADQHNPSHQSVLAQLAEQQTNNRNRMRARGQSRSQNIIQRHGEAVDRLATVAGTSNDIWAIDNALDDLTLTTSQRAHANSVENSDDADTSVRIASRSTLLPVISSSNPYLGPITSARGSSGTSGGMRDFYRRIEDRERSAARSSITTPRVGVPFPESSTGSRSLISTSNQNPGHSSWEQYPSFPPSFIPPSTEYGKLSYTGTKSRAKKVIRYLTQLRKYNNDVERSVQYATKTLGLDSLVENLAKGVEVDLPLRIAELPRPPFSSWLEPGMSWTGKQKGGYGKHDTDFSPVVTAGLTSGPLFDDDQDDSNGFRRSRMPTIEERVLQMRAWRHRERVRAERLAASETERALSRQENASNILGGLNNRLDTLADVERHLTDLLEEEERRQNPNVDDGWRSSDPNFGPSLGTARSTSEVKSTQDEWPVQVTIHNVDWQNMTVSGTMTASQIPQPSQGTGTSNNAEAPTASSAITENNNGEDGNFTGASMETLFDGEIIDFHNHEFETVTDKIGYRVGGLVTDIKYWSRIGPFKEEARKRVAAATEQKALELYKRLGLVGTFDQMREEYNRSFRISNANRDELEQDETAIVVFNTMADCLGSRKWIEETLMGDDGWIFMRWKERSFIAPDTSARSSSSGPSASASGPTPTNTNSSTSVNTDTYIDSLPPGPTRTVATVTSTITRPNSDRNAGINSIPDRAMNVFAETNSMARIRTLVHRASPTTQAFTYTTSYTDERHPDYAVHNGSQGSWGLTIQGFYYVALHRLSGRIDALYFDSGSLPFQELSCVPVDMANKSKSFGFDDKKDGDTEFDWLKNVGLRTNFGTFEFR